MPYIITCYACPGPRPAVLFVDELAAAQGWRLGDDDRDLCPDHADLAVLWERYGCRDFPVERITDLAMRFAVVSPADQTVVYAIGDDPADGHTVDHGKAKLWESAADALRICEWAHARGGLTSADDPWYMVEPVEDVAEFRARPPTW